MRFDVRALMGERSVNLLIRWLPEKYINGDVDTPIDGHKSKVMGTDRVYFKPHTSILTYWLIDKYFDR